MIFIAPAMALALSPEATPVQQLSCILDAIPQRDVEKLGMAALTGTPHDPGSQAKLGTATGACATRFGWQPQEATAFGNLAYITFVMSRAKTMLATSKIDIAHVDAWFAEQPDEARVSSEKLDVEALGKRLMDRGSDRAVVRANSALLARYVNVLIAVERIRLGLPLR